MAYAYFSPTTPALSCYYLAPIFFNFLHVGMVLATAPPNRSCPLLPNLTFMYNLYISTFWNYS